MTYFPHKTANSSVDHSQQEANQTGTTYLRLVLEHANVDFHFLVHVPVLLVAGLLLLQVVHHARDLLLRSSKKVFDSSRVLHFIVDIGRVERVGHPTR